MRSKWYRTKIIPEQFEIISNKSQQSLSQYFNKVDLFAITVWCILDKSYCVNYDELSTVFEINGDAVDEYIYSCINIEKQMPHNYSFPISNAAISNYKQAVNKINNQLKIYAYKKLISKYDTLSTPEYCANIKCQYLDNEIISIIVQNLL